jgi:UDPglucose 6-dehydrogenase
VAIVTEWGEFRNPDFAAVRGAMKSPVMFDGRNLYALSQMRQAGFTYYSIGRAAVRPS